MGFSSPPFSNSWAEIFLTGVVAPELHLEELLGFGTVACGNVGDDGSAEPRLDVGVA